MSEKRINEIEKEIRRLSTERDELLKEEDAKIDEALKSLIGLCFIGKDKNYYMITDIPHPPMMLRPSKTNYFRLPVYKIDIDNKEISFESYKTKIEYWRKNMKDKAIVLESTPEEIEILTKKWKKRKKLGERLLKLGRNGLMKRK